MKCGTTTGYTNGCRCDECKAAKADRDRDYKRRKRNGDPMLRWSAGSDTDEHLARLLNELAPFGLTDDCPARALEKTLAEPSTTAGINQPASSRASRRTA